MTAFKKEVSSFLEQDEAANNLLLGVLQSLSEQDATPLLMAALWKNDDLGLVLFQTHPKQIILSKPTALSSQDIHELGQKLVQTVQPIPGFIGEKKITTELALYVSQALGTHAKIHMEQTIYKLEKVKNTLQTNGKLRRVIASDHAVIKEWIYQFCQETNQPLSLDEASIKATFLINKGNLVAWEVNEELVSMASATRPTQHNITISYVYTPSNQRKKGYASDCVSDFTQRLLDRGYQTTSLYADQSNPTSNYVYRQIGYEPIMDSIVIQFQ
ncbi:GNAT family N-acetyltransferase [Paenibacillus violae]|uniref:GNAT family N-acetyltransferase n=1 Tax=Paenibacillus violae TaxID=3077234 RepID=UPI0028FC3246|nr:GNAT family N-acetyltransferase [Paenibacillus sp. PFR10]